MKFLLRVYLIGIICFSFSAASLHAWQCCCTNDKVAFCYDNEKGYFKWGKLFGKNISKPWLKIVEMSNYLSGDILVRIPASELFDISSKWASVELKNPYHMQKQIKWSTYMRLEDWSLGIIQKIPLTCQWTP